MRVVVMGVSGSGKSTLGAALAQALAADFIDADDLHPTSNIAHMAAGQPLNDAMRWPWLDLCAERLAARPHAVLACSCLKRSYRDRLRVLVPDLQLVYPDISRDVIHARMQARLTVGAHFMPTALLDSQFEALEVPDMDETAIAVGANRPVDAIVSEVMKHLIDK